MHAHQACTSWRDPRFRSGLQLGLWRKWDSGIKQKPGQPFPHIMDAVHGWLDDALTRFNGPLAAEERAQLNTQLVSFQSSSDAFLFATEALKVSSSSLVLHFSASTIERVVSSRWAALGEEAKHNTREALLHFIAARGHEVPGFVLRQAAKALVMIGKNDWPHAYPSFLGDITTMAQQGDAKRMSKFFDHVKKLG